MNGSKEIKQVARNLKSALSADQAQQMVVDYLKTGDAENVNTTQARSFLISLKEIFSMHPQHHQAVLESINSPEKKVAPEVRVAEDFRVFAGFALTDLKFDTSYKKEVRDVLIKGAKILAVTDKATGREDVDYPEHFASSVKESPPLVFKQLLEATNGPEMYRVLKNAIKVENIPVEQGPLFFDEVLQSFCALKVSMNEQIDMLTYIQDKRSKDNIPPKDDPLYDLAVDKAIELIHKSQDPSLRHDVLGRAP